MKIFLDSANIEEIREAYSYGIIDGLTTNPSLIRKAVDARIEKGEKTDMKKYITQILKIAKGTPVSLEVTETGYEGMIHQGKKLYKLFNPIAKNVVIKIPVNTSFSENDNRQFDGLKAIKKLSELKIPVNATLIFTPEQALLAAKAGARFVSPFVGRIDDYIRQNNKIKFEKTEYFPVEGLKKAKHPDDNGIYSGADLVDDCVTIMEMYDLDTEVLAASIRNARQVRDVALIGADIATLPLNVIKDLIKHPKTFEGMQNFTKDIVLEYMELMNGFHTILKMPKKKSRIKSNIKKKRK